MARIRALKPIFFKHSGLYDLEVETGLPVRLAFSGMWCCADREGRFKWRPRELKVDVLPYDEVDFTKVLEALESKGFIVRYEVDGEVYGYIPKWHEHQVVNSREARSTIPTPDTVIAVPRHSNCSCGKEGKGRERKGKEGRVSDATVQTPSPSDSKPDLTEDEQEAVLSHYNRVSKVFRDYFRKCDQKTSYLWKRLKEEIPDEREAESAARDWAEAHEDASYNSPLAAFLGVAQEYVSVDRGDKGDSLIIREKVKELSAEVSKHTNGEVAFNERQQRNLREACETYDTALLLSAFKRFWDKQDTFGMKMAAKNFSETACALGAAEEKIQEKKRRDEANVVAMQEQTLKEAAQIERELEEQKAREAEEAAEIDEPIEF